MLVTPLHFVHYIHGKEGMVLFLYTSTCKMFTQSKFVYPSGTFEEIFSIMIFVQRFEYDVEEYGVSSVIEKYCRSPDSMSFLEMFWYDIFL